LRAISKAQDGQKWPAGSALATPALDHGFLPFFFKLHFSTFNRYNTIAAYVAQLDDDIVIVEGKEDRTGSTGKGIYVWNHISDSPLSVGQMKSKRLYGFSVKLTTRWFPQCNGEFKLNMAVSCHYKVDLKIGCVSRIPYVVSFVKNENLK
jgi:hypothetical protein